MNFTKSEYDIMVNELLFSEHPSFDMLLLISEKTLKPIIEMWCFGNRRLRGGEHENEILQSVQLVLIEKTISAFLLRDCEAGSYRNDPEEFESWMYVVARNETNKYLKMICRGHDEE